MAMANEFSSSRIIAPMLTDCKLECICFFGPDQVCKKLEEVLLAD